jgi:hypothetical protein
MALSDDLARLSVRAKKAEERAAAAKATARDQLEHMVKEARDSTQETADKLLRESSAAAGRADAWADNMQRSWNEHLADGHEPAIDCRGHARQSAVDRVAAAIHRTMLGAATRPDASVSTTAQRRSGVSCPQPDGAVRHSP